MEIVTNIDSKMLKELNRRILWMGIAYLIAGAVVFPIYIIFSSFWYYDFNKILLFMFCLFAVGGAIFVALYFVNIRYTRYKNRSVSCKFYLDYMEYSMLYHGEVEASRKLYYQDICKVKETKNYIFIYIDLANFVPVLKSIVPDLPTLRELINKK